MSRIKSQWPYLLVLLLSILLYHWRILLLGEIICGGDAVSQFIPWREFALREIVQGRFPLWNPFVFCGAPFAANIQTSLFYPLNFFNLIFSVERTFSLALAFHHLLAAVAMYAFLIRLWGDRGGAVIGAIAYSWSGFFITHGSDGHLIHIRAYAWLPLALTLQTQWREGINSRQIVLFALSLAALFYAGHTQIPLYVFYLLIFRSLWWGIQDYRKNPTFRALARYPFWTLAGQALAVGMAALILVPLVELSRTTAGRAGGAEYEFAVSDSMPPQHVLTLIAPFFFGDPSSATREGQFWETRTGYHEISGYIGILPLLLLFFAFLPRNREEDAVDFMRNEVRFFALLAAGGVFFALGSYTPFYKILYYGLPGWSYFRVPGRLLLLFIIGASTLAARGFQVWQNVEFRLAANSRVGLAALLFTFLLIIGTIILANSKEAILFELREFEIDRTITDLGLWTTPRSAISQQLPDFLFDERYTCMLRSCLAACGWLIAGWIALFLVTKTPPRLRWILPALLLTGDLLLFAEHFGKTLPADRWKETHFPNSELIQVLQKNAKGDRILCLDDAIGYPVLNFHPELRPNRLMHYGLATVRGYDPIILKSFTQYVNRIFNKNPDTPQGGLLFFPTLPAQEALDRMDARLILTAQALPDAYPKIWQSKASGLTVYENPGCKSLLYAEKDIESSELTIQIILPNRIDFRIKTPAPNRVFISQVNYPGWSVNTAESGAQLSSANEPFLAVDVPAGDHEISLRMDLFSFSPMSSFVLGGLITVIAIGAGGGMIIWKRRG